jgi:hypothetical protein
MNVVSILQSFDICLEIIDLTSLSRSKNDIGRKYMKYLIYEVLDISCVDIDINIHIMFN